MDYKPGHDIEDIEDWDIGNFRDALHVGVVLTKAEEELQPGQRIQLNINCQGARAALRPDGEQEEAVAVVDPFLSEPVSEGQRFLAWMLPGYATQVRHTFEVKRGRSEWCGMSCG